MIHPPLDKASIFKILETVVDPEIPVLTVMDLGILRDVQIVNGHIDLYITPTYSGCPAMHMIEVQLRAALMEAGYHEFTIHTVLHPAWTTDWISEEGRRKLETFGIAPPQEKDEHPPCPRCGSRNSKELSRFGSTACKALWQCQDCREPFDYFKCH